MADNRLLHELIVANTRANTAISGALENIGDSLAGVAADATDCKAFVAEVRTQHKMFFDYTVKLFVLIQLVELAFIGVLISKVDPARVGGFLGKVISLLQFL